MSIFHTFYFFIFVKARKRVKLTKRYVKFMVLIVQQNARVRIYFKNFVLEISH